MQFWPTENSHTSGMCHDPIISMSPNWFCVALCVGLVTLVASLVASGQGVRAEFSGEPSTVHVSTPVKLEALDFRPPPRNIIDVITARPLFSSSRRPWPAEAPHVEDVSFEVVAVLLTETRPAALVRLGGQERPVWVHETDWLSSWQVDEILADRLLLRRRDEIRIVNIRSEPAENLMVMRIEPVENSH